MVFSILRDDYRSMTYRDDDRPLSRDSSRHPGRPVFDDRRITENAPDRRQEASLEFPPAQDFSRPIQRDYAGQMNDMRHTMMGEPRTEIGVKQERTTGESLVPDATTTIGMQPASDVPIKTEDTEAVERFSPQRDDRYRGEYEYATREASRYNNGRDGMYRAHPMDIPCGSCGYYGHTTRNCPGRGPGDRGHHGGYR